MARKTKPVTTIADLTPDQHNANKGTERGNSLLEQSLRQYGAGRSILADRAGKVIAGNKTLEQAAALGLPVQVVESDGTKLIVVQRTDLSIDEEGGRGLAFMDNRTAEVNLAWDVAEVIAARDKGTLPDWAFTQDELEAMLRADTTATEARGGLTDPDAAPAPPEQPVTRTGDLWILGHHRLLCGDSTKREDVERLMDGMRSPVMPTDPPYLVDYQGGNHPQSWYNKPEVKDKHWDDYQEGQTDSLFADFLAVALECALTDRPAIYQFHATRRQMLVEQAWTANKLLVHQTIIWVKARPILTRSDYMWQHEPCFYGWIEGKRPKKKPPANAKTVWDVDQQGESDGIHPTQKPTELIRRMIDYHTIPGEIVYEPFGGSGTAIIAAEQLDRRCFAMELSPAFCDVIVQRYHEFTGDMPLRGDGVAWGALAPKDAP